MAPGKINEELLGLIRTAMEQKLATIEQHDLETSMIMQNYMRKKNWRQNVLADALQPITAALSGDVNQLWHYLVSGDIKKEYGVITEDKQVIPDVLTRAGAEVALSHTGYRDEVADVRRIVESNRRQAPKDPPRVHRPPPEDPPGGLLKLYRSLKDGILHR